ncbi:hypothetical protein BJ912DRAFT_938865, partial [Pholiota molesta]
PKAKPKEISPPVSEVAPGPVNTPSPTPEDALVTDPSSLHALIASVPAQTLHAYALTRLNPTSSLTYPLLSHIASPLPAEPPNSQILTALTTFFSSLAPPPKLHCVRCHRGYFDLENNDTACRIAHDDDSAIVERVGLGRGAGTEYETLWGCCGSTVEGDGDMGPPDGWCYEGAHTTDTKRARFRADSSPQDDKLTSCERLRCHMPPRPPRSSLGRASRKRNRKTLEEDEDDDDAQSVASSHARSHTRSISTASMKEKAKMKATADGDDNAEEKTRPAKRVRSRKSSAIVPPAKIKDEDAMDRKTKATSKTKPVSPTPKPHSTMGNSLPTQRSPLSASFIPSTAIPTARSESPTRRPKNRVEVELISRTPKGTLSAKSSMGSLKAPKAKGSMSSLKAAHPMPKALGEIVDTSVDGEGWS